MECGNCGKYGHSFRDCKDPVTSFGICAIKIIDNSPSYLMIRRRDSLAYVEFMRGKYKLDQLEYIETLINGMTKEERDRLLVLPFDTLWEKLWFGQITRQFRNEYEHAKRIFESIKNTGDATGKLLIRYINTTTAIWEDAEWGFPKGRRTFNESTVSCALREFTEETGIPGKYVTLMNDEEPLIEEYIGTNGVPYKQLYYIGICAYDTIAQQQPNNKVMNREVGNIGWFSYENAFQKIRPTNNEKRNVLTKLHTRLQSETMLTKIKSILEWKNV